MSALTESQIIERAASVMKVMRLVHTPGMDHVAVKLNMQPTYEELRTAKAWFDAIERCRDPQQRVLNIAQELDAGR